MYRSTAGGMIRDFCRRSRRTLPTCTTSGYHHSQRCFLSSSSSKTSATASTGGIKTNSKFNFFESSLKEHYYRNKLALDRIGLSFLFFYVTGQIFMQKTKTDELQEELDLVVRDRKGLEMSLKDPVWTKDVAKRLGVNSEHLGQEISLQIRRHAGELTADELDLSKSTEGEASSLSSSSSSSTSPSAAATKRALY